MQTAIKKKKMQLWKTLGKENLAGYGLDLVEGVVRNNLEAGVLEPAMSKSKSIQFATEAAITVLRIDDCARVANNDPQQ